MSFAVHEDAPIFVPAESFSSELSQASPRVAAALREAALEGRVHIVAFQGDSVKYLDNNQSVASQLGIATLRLVEEEVA